MADDRPPPRKLLRGQCHQGHGIARQRPPSRQQSAKERSATRSPTAGGTDTNHNNRWTDVLALPDSYNRGVRFAFAPMAPAAEHRRGGCRDDAPGPSDGWPGLRQDSWVVPRLASHRARRTGAGWTVLCLASGAAIAAAGTAGCRHGRHEPSPPVGSAEPVSAPRQAEALAPVPATVPSPAAYADGGAPSGYEHVAVWDLVPAGDGAAVLLLDASQTTVLPIFVGGTEALTIRLDLDGKRYERPLTHDLLASIVRELGGQPVKTQIDDLRDDTYFGSVFVRQGDRVLELDARPSDAIAIALGSGAPLYVSRSVLLSSGVPKESIDRDSKSPRELAAPKKRVPIAL